MNRRGFLTLAVKVAGAVVLLPRVAFPGPLNHSMGSEWLRLSMMNGLFNASKCKAFLRTCKGTFTGDGLGVIKVQTIGGQLILSYEAFEVVEPFQLIGYTFVDEHGWVLSVQDSFNKPYVVNGDRIQLSHTITL